MTVEEVKMLKRLVAELRPNPVIINIGAERGTSTLAMLEERNDSIIFSIDVAPCEGEFENARKAGLDDSRIIRCLGSSQNIGRSWPFYVDFIWVDGDHSYVGVKADIDAWLPRISSGGIIAFHDYFEDDPPPHNPSGAGQAVREKMIDKYDLIASVDRLRAFRI
jgi:predicted O-methyltransferase YrrM